MRIVTRESVQETMLLRLAGNDRPVEVEAVIDVNGRVKVKHVVDGTISHAALSKPKGRFAILATVKEQTATRDLT